MWLIAAISIGFIGSAHCIGMCGPLMIAVQGKSGFRNGGWLYHIGRLLTYATLGTIAGALGSTFNMMGSQQVFSIALGIGLIALVALWPVLKWVRSIEGRLSGLTLAINAWVRELGMTGPKAKFFYGVANGFLPCGLVYMGLVGAANTFTPWEGAAFMVVFGLGTVPALAVLGLFSQSLSLSFRNRIKRIIPFSLVLMGALLIARGMNLGIPYVSPEAPTTEQIADCK